jgi:predicted DNA-binding transcriptional regulator YafY
MPTRKTQSTLARQWELLKLLPSRGTGKTAKQLAEALNDAGFKISKRQVERDLADLYDASLTVGVYRLMPPSIYPALL